MIEGIESKASISKGNQTMIRSKRIWFGTGCGTGCLVPGSILAMIGIFCAIVVFLIPPSFKELKNVQLDIKMPSNITQDKISVMEVNIKNTADQPILLHSLHVSSTFLNLVKVEKTEPSFVQVFQVPNAQAYEFNQTISPGEDLTVKFSLMGIQSGSYSGDIGISTESGYLVRSVEIAIVE